MRFALLIHGRDPADTPLSDYTLTAAAIVADCLADHAAKVFSGSDKGTGDARYLLRRIGELGGEFGKQELWQKAKGRFASAGAFDEALRTLEESGYIRLQEIQTSGRPVVRIQVNPAVNST